MVTYRYENENPMTSGETLVKQNESGWFCLIKKYLAFWKNVVIILVSIKLGISRLFLKRNVKINNNFLLRIHPVRSRLLLVAYFIFLFLFVFAARLAVDASPANGETITYESAIVWRADGAGDYTLPPLTEKETTTSTPAIATKGVVKSVTVAWASEGDVQLSVSADDGLHYTPVVNGVPLVSGFPGGYEPEMESGSRRRR